MPLAPSPESTPMLPVSSTEHPTQRPPGRRHQRRAAASLSKRPLQQLQEIHLLRDTPIGWLDGLKKDAPIAIGAETHGPGDDVRLELATGEIAEVQAK